jgi:thioesterase domain-containing protein
VLFRAGTLPIGLDAAYASREMGWGQLVENLHVEVIPGYFTTLISEPRVRVLAERLSRRLNAISPSASVAE